MKKSEELLKKNQICGDELVSLLNSRINRELLFLIAIQDK